MESFSSRYYSVIILPSGTEWVIEINRDGKRSGIYKGEIEAFTELMFLWCRSMREFDDVCQEIVK
jgi:hypothetical protein